ncbi:MAG: hypothetical protein N3F07_02250 [Candidatus Micrarchaeota archaeon]|nr:hypothetical protein [Candidatus Micrarchaeota archaeon]
MVSLKKYVLCKCGASNSFEFLSQMPIEDISVSARCASCGASIHISISSLLSSPASSPASAQGTSIGQADSRQKSLMDSAEQETKENVEQALRDLFR